MGHYSSDYAYEAERRRKAYYEKCTEALKKFNAFRSALPGDTPQRFLHALEDLENWIDANKGTGK